MMLNTKWLKGRHKFIYFYKDCGKAIIREGVNNKKPTLKKSSFLTLPLDWIKKNIFFLIVTCIMDVWKKKIYFLSNKKNLHYT